MELNFIRKSSLMLALFATTTLTHALPCPSVNTVQENASKIDTVEYLGDSFFVYTSTPAFYESKLPWYIGLATYLTSEDEALNQGKDKVQHINVNINAHAYDDKNGHNICIYQPGYVVAIGGSIDQVFSSRLR